MMNKGFLITILLFGISTCGPTFVKAATTPRNKIDVSDAITNNVYKIQVDVNLNQFSEKEVLVKGTPYQILTLPEYGYTSEIGKPKLPAIRFLLAVPSLSDISIKTIERGYSILPKEYKIYPVQEPVPWYEYDSQKFTIDKSFYNTDILYPGKLANVGNKGILRDYNVIQLEIFPFQYNPATKEVRFYSDLLVGLEFKEKPTKYRESALFEDFYKSIIYNYDAAKNWTPTSEMTEGSGGSGVLGGSENYDYLIVVYDDFYNSILDLRDWKIGKGLAVEVTKTSEIPDGGDGLDDGDIRDYIKGEYEDWGISYVLLAGDVEHIPTHYYPGLLTAYTASDHYYSDLDYLPEHDEPYFSEVFVGRVSIKNNLELDAIVDKIISYEKIPYVEETDWYKKAMMWYANDVPTAVDAAIYIRDLLIANDYTCVDMFNAPESAPPPYTTSDVSSAINDGRGLATYIGHGTRFEDPPTEWSDIPFTNLDVLNLTNGRKLTLITTVACYSGGFDYSPSDCIGEVWVKGDTSKFPEVNGGIGYFGPSRPSSKGYAEKIMEGVYAGIFNESLFNFAKATNKGKIYMYNHYGNSSTTQAHFELFNNLGDPELEIWTEIPTPQDTSKFYIKNSSGVPAAWFGNLGNLVLKGTLTRNTTPEANPDRDEFRVQDSSGADVAIIDATNGNMYIKGLLQLQWQEPSEQSDDFIIKNSSDEVVGYINESGELYLKGRLYENSNP